MSSDRNLTISLGFPLTRFPRHPEEPHLHIRLSDGFRQVRRQQESTPRPRCEWRNVPWILNCCDSLVYCKLLDMWCEAIHWFNFNLMWCNGCTLDVMYACNRINFDVTNVWLSRYTSQWQQKNTKHNMWQQLYPIRSPCNEVEVDEGCVSEGDTQLDQLGWCCETTGPTWKTCFVCEAPVFVS